MGMMTETSYTVQCIQEHRSTTWKKADNKLGKERLRLYKKLNIALQSWYFNAAFSQPCKETQECIEQRARKPE